MTTMGDAPFDPPAGNAPDGRGTPDAADATAGGSAAGGASEEVLDKLEALLGRLRGPDAPAEHPLAHPEIPTLDQAVTWQSPDASPWAVPAGRHIPTLTESVQLRERLEAPPALAAGGTAASGLPPAPLLEALPDAASLAGPALPEPLPLPLPLPLLEPEPEPAEQPPQRSPDPITRQELRERVESLLDPTLEDRLCERAMSDLDRTLMDVERGLRDELEAWRADREAQIRDQVRGEIERAVDEVVAALARERGSGLH